MKKPRNSDERRHGRAFVAAVAELLDSGGQTMVTLRGVAAGIGVSHNAPYKHFSSRDDLLAAVAAADFVAMSGTWRAIRTSQDESVNRLVAVLDVAIGFAREHPARHRLLFESPDLATREGSLRPAAGEALDEFTALVEELQFASILPAAPPHHLAVVLSPWFTVSSTRMPAGACARRPDGGNRTRRATDHPSSRYPDM